MEVSGVMLKQSISSSSPCCFQFHSSSSSSRRRHAAAAAAVVHGLIPCSTSSTTNPSLNGLSSSFNKSTLRISCSLPYGGTPYPMLDSFSFRDQGHMQYYNSVDVVKSECKNKKKKESSVLKKRLKLLKGVSKDLSTLSDISPHESLLHQTQSNLIQEATEVLMKQLQQLKAEQKELKMKKKEEKAMLKATRMKMQNSESSSSSESSDGECGEAIDMSRLRKETVTPSMLDELQQFTQKGDTSILPVLPTQELIMTEINGCSSQKLEEPSTSCSNTNPVHCNGISTLMTTGTEAKRIEVCMGNKCKKSGGALLLEEFVRVSGLEGVAVGCKCMGKCRDGPNVRVVSPVNEGADGLVRTQANPLCIGVGLEDVGAIVANFLGEGKDLGLAPAS